MKNYNAAHGRVIFCQLNVLCLFVKGTLPGSLTGQIVLLKIHCGGHADTGQMCY